MFVVFWVVVTSDLGILCLDLGSFVIWALVVLIQADFYKGWEVLHVFWADLQVI